MRELKGKCKEYIEQGKCLGCMQLENADFTGDDNCYVIKEREQLEKNYAQTKIDEIIERLKK